MKILLATDAFPPVAGGSGWSTYELARGLRSGGHDVIVVQPRPGTPSRVREREFDGLRVVEIGAAAPAVPFVRNYFKSERLTRILSAFLATVAARERVDIVHGQHVMTGVASVDAAANARIPSVVTVRDYWPICYWSTLLPSPSAADLCPACTAGNMARCLAPRARVLVPAALPMIPYMRANLARKRRGLAEASAVIAVSRRIADDLRARAPELAGSRLAVIPNPVDITALRTVAAGRPTSAPAGAYAVYVGKLAANKGADHLVRVVERSGLDWPLVIVGDGPDRAAIERDARASGRDIRFTGWVEKDDAVRLLAHAALLVFPSRGPESLSRVLTEASALGVPIAAMDTGGTRDIVEPDVTGLLSRTPEGLADHVKQLRGDEALRARLGHAARQRAERDFDAAAVVERIVRLYEELRATRP